jgi:Domain of unknown function (DUF362)
MDRRRFLMSSAFGLGAAAGGLLGSASHAEGASRVVFYRHSGLATQDKATAAATVRGLVDAAVAKVTGKGDPGSAWRSLFKSDDVVAIKVNCMAGMLAPSWGVVAAVVEGLKGVGVDPDRVTVYDKEDRDLLGAGYELRHEPPGPLVMGTIGGPKPPDYCPRVTTRGQTTFRLSNIVAERTTAIINVPVAKDHVFAGITGALKNHFGSIHNPEDFHYINGCSPAVAEVNLAADLRSKQRLIVGDALRVQYDGGPSYEPKAIHGYGGVFAAIDPVALDSQLFALIETLREQNGLKPLADEGRPVRYLEKAAEKELGTLDPKQIELIYSDLAEGR